METFFTVLGWIIAVAILLPFVVYYSVKLATFARRKGEANWNEYRKQQPSKPFDWRKQDGEES